MRLLNWSHAIIGFLIGIALVLYIRGGQSEDGSILDSNEVVEGQTE